MYHINYGRLKLCYLETENVMWFLNARPKNKTQMPQKFLVAKKTNVIGAAAQLFASLPGIANLKAAVKSAEQYRNIEATVVQTSSEKLDLSVKPKGEIQYVR